MLPSLYSPVATPAIVEIIDMLHAYPLSCVSTPMSSHSHFSLCSGEAQCNDMAENLSYDHQRPSPLDPPVFSSLSSMRLSAWSAAERINGAMRDSYEERRFSPSPEPSDHLAIYTLDPQALYSASPPPILPPIGAEQIRKVDSSSNSGSPSASVLLTALEGISVASFPVANVSQSVVPPSCTVKSTLKHRYETIIKSRFNPSWEAGHEPRFWNQEGDDEPPSWNLRNWNYHLWHTEGIRPRESCDKYISGVIERQGWKCYMVNPLRHAGCEFCPKERLRQRVLWWNHHANINIDESVSSASSEESLHDITIIKEVQDMMFWNNNDGGSSLADELASADDWKQRIPDSPRIYDSDSFDDDDDVDMDSDYVMST